jgi:uncharacterized OsmC-like protein
MHITIKAPQKQEECDDIQPMAKFKLIGVMGCVTMDSVDILRFQVS